MLQQQVCDLELVVQQSHQQRSNVIGLGKFDVGAGVEQLRRLVRAAVARRIEERRQPPLRGRAPPTIRNTAAIDACALRKTARALAGRNEGRRRADARARVDVGPAREQQRDGF